MKTRRDSLCYVPCLFLLLVIVAAALSDAGDLSENEEDYEYSYDDDENYTYLNEEDLFESQGSNGRQPQFETEAQHFRVELGHTIRLPCRVDSLGHTVMGWKKKANKTLSDEENYQQLAIGTRPYNDRISVEIEEDKGSTLVITLANKTDMGEYICWVSSKPEATLRHMVSHIVPPTVEILKPYKRGNKNGTSEAKAEEIRLNVGDDLTLVCQGTGEPPPSITWRRERKRMPDGRGKVTGGKVLYENVTRKHSGHYICEGRNGPGKSAKDVVRINVLHSPEISTKESYKQESSGVRLELLCVVHAFPRPKVTWYKDGDILQDNSTRLSITHTGSKHLLLVYPVEQSDRGRYTCHALNSIGEAKGNIQVMGIDEDLSDTLFLVEDSSELPQGADSKDSRHALPVSNRGHEVLHSRVHLFLIILPVLRCCF